MQLSLYKVQWSQVTTMKLNLSLKLFLKNCMLLFIYFFTRFGELLFLYFARKCDVEHEPKFDKVLSSSTLILILKNLVEWGVGGLELPVVYLTYMYIS